MLLAILHEAESHGPSALADVLVALGCTNGGSKLGKIHAFWQI